MTVEVNTGVLTWKPSGSQLGTVDVTLSVADGQGGTAQQQYQIRTGAAAGNQAPIITSDAVVNLNQIGGKIIVSNDEWPLSNRGFQLAPDTANFVSNITNWFTGGKTGNFYAYSNNFGLTDSLLAQTMTANGNTFTVGTNPPATPQDLLQYDGIFLGELPYNHNFLTD
jgi:hypothetical protein